MGEFNSNGELISGQPITVAMLDQLWAKEYGFKPNNWRKVRKAEKMFAKREAAQLLRSYK